MKKNVRTKKDAAKSRKAKARAMLSSAHILISVVALLECLILIIFTTYSWIETSSSLIIMNGTRTTSLTSTMPITKAMNYRYTIPSSGSVSPSSDDPDLNSNFSFVKYFQMCKTSSPDGSTFYFPKSNSTHGSYRKGDTTDYNTSYIYFDVQVKNEKSSTQGFYFANSNIFSLGDNELTDPQKNALLDAMRLSIQTDDDRATIYSKNGTTANSAINNTSGGTTAASSLAFSGYTSSAADADKLFTVTSNSTVNVSFRVWVEMTELFSKSSSPFYNQAANSALMQKLYNTPIKVDFDLDYATTTAVRFYFDDYSFATTGANIGQHLTTLDSDYIMYYYDGKGYYYPMTLSSAGSLTTPARWVTANATGTASATIPEADVSASGRIVSGTAPRYSYFVYASNNRMGYVRNGTAPNNFKYKWDVDGRRPPVYPTGLKYRFNGYSVAVDPANDNLTVGAGTIGNGLGDWDTINSTATLINISDQTTGWNGGTDYNTTNNTGLVTNNATAALYMYGPTYSKTYDGNTMTVSSTTLISKYSHTRYLATFFKDAEDGYYKGYVPSTWLSENPDIFYFSGGTYVLATPGHLNTNNGTYTSYSSGINYTMHWTASSPESQGAAYVYTLLGYNDDTAFSSITGSVKKNGLGTWQQTAAVSFDSELLDTDLAASNKYKISFDGTNFYHMVGNAACNTFTAYAPVGETLTFSRTNSSNATVKWDGDVWTNYADDTVFYATATTSGTANWGTGQWHIAVFVDGTYSNLVYNTVGTSAFRAETGGSLQYSVDGTTYYDMSDSRLDQYRWYVPSGVMTSAHETIWYRWYPYGGSEFSYRQDLSNGIYYVVVEGADESYWSSP